MRRILVDRARARRMAKRSGRWARVTLDDGVRAAASPINVDVLDLDAALTHLAVFDSRKRQLAELRFFGGLSLEEAGEALGISTATADRDWQTARAWLLKELPRDALTLSPATSADPKPDRRPSSRRPPILVGPARSRGVFSRPAWARAHEAAPTIATTPGRRAPATGRHRQERRNVDLGARFEVRPCCRGGDGDGGRAEAASGLGSRGRGWRCVPILALTLAQGPGLPGNSAQGPGSRDCGGCRRRPAGWPYTTQALVRWRVRAAGCRPSVRAF